jgi:hypothetical protein
MLLRTLPVEERQAVLLDLLAAYELEVPSKATAAAMAAVAPVTHVRAIDAESAPAEKAAPAVPSAAASAGASSLSDRLLAILREQPEAPIELLSQTLCGATDNANRNRVSTTLSYLKRRGKVRNVGPGKWRVVESKRAAKPKGAAKSAPKAAEVEEAPPAKAERTSAPQASGGPSAAERVRALLVDHPEGLTTGQIRDLLGPNRPRDISTVVAKMAGRGLLIASGKKGAFSYKLAQASGAAPSSNGNG